MSKLDKMAKADQMCLVGSKKGGCKECIWYSRLATGGACGQAHGIGLGRFNALLGIIKRLSHE